MKKTISLLAACTLLLTSCGGVDNPSGGGGNGSGKTVRELKCTTGEAADIKENSAVLKGSVFLKTDKAASGTAWFYFGTDQATLTTKGEKINAGTFSSKDYTETTVNFSATLSGLTPNTTFYYVLAASADGKESTGNVVSFKTAGASTPSEPGEADSELVDLGLSVKWRAWNLGATKPEDAGDYYAWGEIATKNRYQMDTYKWSDATFETLKKYNATDGLTKLAAADDAAAVKLGGKYRMPTADEFKDLREKCTWTFGKVNDVEGYTVTAANGNSIFLPLCGMRYEDQNLHKDYGLYWSSNVDPSYFHALSLSLHDGEVKEYDIQRFVGFTIRPVSD